MERFFTEIHDFMRLASILLIVVCILQMVMMLSHYWHRAVPLRKRMMKQDRHNHIFILAPPVFWTFTYHLTVTAIFLFAGIGLIQSLLAVDRPPTVFTYASPWLFLTMTVVLSRFMEYYSKSLNEAQWRLLRDEIYGKHPTRNAFDEDDRPAPPY